MQKTEQGLQGLGTESLIITMVEEDSICEEAYDAWFKKYKEKINFHTHKIKIENHPIYLKDKLKEIKEDQFGFDGFGLEKEIKKPILNYLKGYKEKQFNNALFSIRNHKFKD